MLLWPCMHLGGRRTPKHPHDDAREVAKYDRTLSPILPNNTRSLKGIKYYIDVKTLWNTCIDVSRQHDACDDVVTKISADLEDVIDFLSRYHDQRF